MEPTYYFSNINLEDGISQCVITDMLEDKNGFVWIGTYDGLNRYDGASFKIFRHNSYDSLSLPASKINKIYYDQDHHLWVSTPTALSIFDIEKGQVVGHKLNKKYQFRSACQNGSNSTWALSSAGSLVKLNSDNLKVIKTSSVNHSILPNEKIIHSFYNDNKVCLVSSNGNCHFYNTKKGSWASYKNNLELDGVKFTTAAFDGKNTLYLASMGIDLIEYNINTHDHSFSPINTMGAYIIGIRDLRYDQNSQELFITSYGQGCFIYHGSTNNLSKLSDKAKGIKLSSDYPVCFYRDQQNIYWIGYDGKGIDILDPNVKKFVPIKNESEQEEFQLQFVRKIVEDKKEKLWFGTAGSGLVKYDRTRDAFTFFNTNELNPIADNFIIEMVHVNNEIWLGLNNGDILVFDINKEKAVNKISVSNKWNRFGQNGIWSFYHDSLNHEVWVGTSHGGISKVDVITKSVKDYDQDTNTIFNDNKVRTLYKSESGVLYAGTTKGILRYNSQQDKFDRVYPKSTKTYSSIHSIKCIHQDQLGQLWVGTDGAGIIILDKNFNRKSSISVKNKLSNNVIYGILAATSTSYWASSNEGLINIKWKQASINDSLQYKLYNYKASRGLQSKEFNTNSYLKLKDGSLAFGGIAGVNIFKGENIEQSIQTPKVAITDFSVFNKKINDKKLIPYTNQIDLNFNQNSFSISFQALGFNMPDEINYQYRLIGLTNDWIDAGTRNYESFTNLSPGTYTFQVKASNYDGKWNSDFTSITVRIKAPLYHRWWFILGAVLLLLFLIYSFAKYKSQVRANREELKLSYTKEIAEVEMKALRAQINPHFLFNSLNSINNFILKNENKKARKYLVKFSQLVRNILNNSSSSYISLKEEIDTINLYIEIESMRFDSEFKYSVRIDEKLSVNEISIPSLLLQPYIENAIWHGLIPKTGERKIDIRISQTNKEYVNIEIEDNGIGRIAAQKNVVHTKRRSFGMQLGENRLKLMNSENQKKANVEVIDLYTNKDEGSGTLIKINLPFKKFTKDQQQINHHEST